MRDLTPVLVSSSVSTLLQYTIYTSSVDFIMQLLNSVVGIFFTVLPVLLIALLWTSSVVNVSAFNRLTLAFTVLTYNILINTEKVPYSGKQKQ